MDGSPSLTPEGTRVVDLRLKSEPGDRRHSRRRAPLRRRFDHVYDRRTGTPSIPGLTKS